MIKKLGEKEFKILFDLTENYIVDDNIFIEYSLTGFRVMVKKKIPQSILKDLSINEPEVAKAIGSFIMVFEMLMKMNYDIPKFRENFRILNRLMK